MRAFTLNGAAFAAGLATLGLELTALRMFAPYFGASVIVSGAVITMVLVFLTLGYWFGGIWIDRKAAPSRVFAVILASGLYSVGTALLFRSLLGALETMPLFWGASLAAATLFGVPMLLLGMVAPCVVKLTAKAGVGHAAGRVSAVGTIGAILGSVLTTFWLIPTHGTTTTQWLMTGILLLVGALGLATKTKWALASLILLGLAGMPEAPTSGVLWETESSYNHVLVQEDEQGLRRLYLNQPKWVQSVHPPEGKRVTGGYFELFNAGPLLAGGPRALIVGLGAGTSARELLSHFQDIKIDAIEIDAKVVQAAHRFFDLPRDPRLNVVVGDGRRFVKRVRGEYDFVELDVYHGGPHVPFYLVTREAFTEVARAMTDNGVLMVNVISPHWSNKRHLLVDSIGLTLETVFPTVASADLGANHLLVASRSKADVSSWSASLEKEAVPGAEAMSFLLQEFTPVGDRTAIPLLTDDLAPLEELTRAMLSARSKG